MSEMTLRGKVLSRYKTVSDFAEAIGWSRNKASRIVNGVQEPDTNEMQQLAELLQISTAEDFTALFFPKMSTKWTA